MKKGEGNYEYDATRESIVFHAMDNSSVYREGTLKEGVIFLFIPIAGKTAQFEFER